VHHIFLTLSELLCKARISRDGRNVVFESALAASVILETQIKDDKKFGFLSPTNGILRYAIMNRDDRLSERDTKKMIGVALWGWEIETPINFVRVLPTEYSDMKIYFRDEVEDPNLDSHTLAYHYYPIASIGFRGVCVINKRFYKTLHGNVVSLHLIDPIHYPDPDTAPVQGKTWDGDTILRHEFGHGVFGLPHSLSTGRTMYGNYEGMAEYFHEEDIRRAQAKAGKRNILSRLYLRMKKHYIITSER